MKDRVKMILYLHPKENPILSRDIETQVGISGETLRGIINELRVERFPIGSDRRGYFWAKDRSELQPTINNLESREIGIRNARHGLEDCFSKDSQLPLI